MNPLYLLIILQLLDILTTYVSVSGGRAQEANPIVAKLINKFGLLPGLLMIKVPLIAFFWVFQAEINSYLVWALVAFYAAVIVNNYRVMTR